MQKMPARQLLDPFTWAKAVSQYIVLTLLELLQTNAFSICAPDPFGKRSHVCFPTLHHQYLTRSVQHMVSTNPETVSRSRKTKHIFYQVHISVTQGMELGDEVLWKHQTFHSGQVKWADHHILIRCCVEIMKGKSAMNTSQAWSKDRRTAVYWYLVQLILNLQRMILLTHQSNFFKILQTAYNSQQKL